MNGLRARWNALDEESRRFLRRTGVAVILVEIAVLTGVWLFQQHFGR